MSGGGRRWILVLVTLAGAVFLFDAWRYAGHQLDDSFITFRYARNLAEGNGLVFNPGERVEGYTNLLFVLLSAALMRIGADPLLGTTIVTGVAALAALALTYLLCKEVMRGDRRCALLAMGLLMATEGFAYWSVMSMETMLFTALLAWGLLLLLRGGRTTSDARPPGASVLLAVPLVLVVLTRPEGAAVAVLGATLWAVMQRRRAGGWGHLRRLAPAAAITAASIVALFAWRLWYYGRLVPNTFHAKVTGDQGQILTGLAYLGDWSLASPLFAGALLAPLALLSRRVRERLGKEHPAGLLWSVAIFIVVTGVALGGDSMPFFRFFVPAMPLLAVVAATGAAALLGWNAVRGARRAVERHIEGVSADRIGSAPGLNSSSDPENSTQPDARTRRLARWAVIAALPITVAASHATIQPYRAFVAHRTAVVGAAVGKWFARELASDELMAINTVGALPWKSDLPTLDMLGLTDAAIAARPVWVASAGWAGHRRGWGDYVMRRRPHAILWYNSAGSTEPFYLGDRELAADPYFRFFYRLHVERLPALDGSAPRASRQGRSKSGGEPGTPRGAAHVQGGTSAGGTQAGAPGAARVTGATGEAAAIADPNDDEPSADRLEPRRRAARVGSLRPLARFPGYPFGFHPEGDAVAPELGVRAVFRETPVPHTTFVEHPITVHWFELDPRDAALWPLREKHAGAIEAFVGEVAAEWVEAKDLDVPAHDALSGPAQHEEARLRVEQLCAEAYAAVQAGDFASAKAILARAANLNRLARVPLVYQYMANVAVVTGDLLAAVPAQKEALRLDPGNALYAQNLARLLRAPFGKVPAAARPPKQ